MDDPPQDLSPQLFYGGPVARSLDLDQQLDFEIEDGAVTGAASQMEVEACAADFALLNYYCQLLGSNLALGACTAFELHETSQTAKFERQNDANSESWYATIAPTSSS